MKEKTLKVYKYKLIYYKSESVEHYKIIKVYAFNKKESDSLMNIYSKNKFTYTHIRTTKIENDKEVQYYINKYGSVDAMMQKQKEIAERSYTPW